MESKLALMVAVTGGCRVPKWPPWRPTTLVTILMLDTLQLLNYSKKSSCWTTCNEICVMIQFGTRKTNFCLWDTNSVCTRYSAFAKKAPCANDANRVTSLPGNRAKSSVFR